MLRKIEQFHRKMDKVNALSFHQNILMKRKQNRYEAAEEKKKKEKKKIFNVKNGTVVQLPVTKTKKGMILTSCFCNCQSKVQLLTHSTTLALAF